MIGLAFDATKLITVMVHTGAALTEAELARVLANIDVVAAAVAKQPTAFATTIVIVETDNGPNATQRKRIGEAAKKLARNYQVLVTHSSIVRAIMTAIRWLSPASENIHHRSYATYEEARTWLVASTGHPAEVIDAVHANARAELRVGVRVPAA